MKNIIKISFLFMFLATFGDLDATIYQTVANGNWKSSSTWSPSKPTFPWGSTDTVIISHTINLDKSITTYGVVIVSSGASLTTTSKSITVGDGSTFTNNGTVSVKSFSADWGTTTIVNTGSLSTTNNLNLNEGTFSNSGTLSVGNNFTNNYDSEFENTSTGVITVSNNFTNRDEFTNAGSLTVGGNFLNDWGHTVVNTGTISATKDITNKGTLTTSGTMTAGDDIINKGTLTNTGTMTATDDIVNDWSCTLTNSGAITAGDDFTNKGTITNSNTIDIGDDFKNDYSSTITNTGAITVADNALNHGTIHNDGSFEIDGNYTGAGDVDGTGSLCNSDGVTDPTGGAKSVSCPICGDGGSLPVEIIDFSAKFNNDIIEIEWVTASETNNDRFEIESSIDGYDFEIIGSVKGHGNSNVILSYTFTDLMPQSGVNYYRLKQVDFDGTITYSEIIQVGLDKKHEVKVYPNPVISGENLTIECDNTNEKLIEIYDISGKLLQRVSTTDNTYQLNTSELKPGLFILRIISNNEIISRKIQIR